MSGVNATGRQTRSGPAHRQALLRGPRISTAVTEDGPCRLRAGALDGQAVLATDGADAVVITTTSGPDKARPTNDAGAHLVSDRRQDHPAAEVRTITPDGVDIVNEVALGANLALDLDVLRTRSTISTCVDDVASPSH